MTKADDLARAIADALAWQWAYAGRGRVARPPNRHERRHAAALARQRAALLQRMAAHQRARKAARP